MNEDLDEFSDIGEQIDIQNEPGIKFTTNQFEDDIDEDLPEEIEESALRP